MRRRHNGARKPLLLLLGATVPDELSALVHRPALELGQALRREALGVLDRDGRCWCAVLEGARGLIHPDNIRLLYEIETLLHVVQLPYITAGDWNIARLAAGGRQKAT